MVQHSMTRTYLHTLTFLLLFYFKTHTLSHSFQPHAVCCSAFLTPFLLALFCAHFAFSIFFCVSAFCLQIESICQSRALKHHSPNTIAIFGGIEYWITKQFFRSACLAIDEGRRRAADHGEWLNGGE
ncbi:unnamed protein product [Ceratitis capitata]|uniref:(Mediterranean fruit fly) hypothetical protein n=1 Tax=Ceratitis capitata TaxID=7213 RepID=A0A811V7R3_CERCA|nr:unnamed protein product [Ceratitis capitata]